MKETRVITCLTCAHIASANAVMPINEQALTDAIWSVSWNVISPVEEMEAFLHAQANPRHIMVNAIDFGFAVNGV